MTRPLAELRERAGFTDADDMLLQRDLVLALLDCADALARADAWYGDGITDPTRRSPLLDALWRGIVKAALAALERAGWSVRP